jgi:hypothetical protein
LPGQYDFAELFGWLKPVQNAVFQVKGTQSTDIDERRNRLVVGVLDEQSRASVLNIVAKLGIPRNAVIVEIEPRFLLSADSLTGRVRPIKGGLGIQSSKAFNNLCTLGFIIKMGSAAFPYYFMTNSHCTEVVGGEEGTSFWQPQSSFYDSFIGTEVSDPRYNKASDVYCPKYQTPYGSFQFMPCRWSDAAYASYAPQVQSSSGFGKIARPYPPGTSNPRLIDPGNPTFTITSETQYAALGTSLNMVGASSGWRTGTVSRTCRSIELEGKVLMCQSYAYITSEGGDSGAPVFFRNSGDQVSLYGIVWGRSNTYGDMGYSPMEGLHKDFGTFTVVAPYVPPPPPGGCPDPQQIICD